MREGSAINSETAIHLRQFPAELIRNRMREVVNTDNGQVQEIMDYLLASQGKMLRPRLVYLSASFYDNEAETVRDIAVAIELIHMASLVHDDIIDQAMIRRGQSSLNSHWGEKISVLTGDYLFATAFNLIARLGLPEVMDNLSQAIQIMCSGEIMQLRMSFDDKIREDDYFDKTFRKTACLFASACKLGALASRMPSAEIKLLEQYGLCLGYAYQIIDDVLDYVAESDTIGKPAGADLLEGNITLPVILALNHEEYGLKIRDILNKGNITAQKLPAVVQILNTCEALEDSIKWAGSFMQYGLEALSTFPESASLCELKDFCLLLLDGYYNRCKISRLGPMEA